MTPAEQWKQRLRQALVEAMRAKDADAVSAIRQAVSALDQAEAVAATTTNITSGPIAGAVAGLGAGDAPRRVLSEVEVLAVLERECAERAAAIEQLKSLGHDTSALERQAQALAKLTH